MYKVSNRNLQYFANDFATTFAENDFRPYETLKNKYKGNTNFYLLKAIDPNNNVDFKDVNGNGYKINGNFLQVAKDYTNTPTTYFLYWTGVFTSTAPADGNYKEQTLPPGEYIIEAQGSGGKGGNGGAIKSGAGGGAGVYLLFKKTVTTSLTIKIGWKKIALTYTGYFEINNFKVDSGRPGESDNPGEGGKINRSNDNNPLETFADEIWEARDGIDGGWRSELFSPQFNIEQMGPDTYYQFKRGGFQSKPSNIYSGNGAPSMLGDGGNGVSSGSNGNPGGIGAGGGGGASKAFGSTTGGNGGDGIIRVWKKTNESINNNNMLTYNTW